ncbi:MAG: hypothetical protein QJR06_03990 [Alicyclobacillaceae bacterium]|nr:hypothetical protein [Alicyclobacillaceae bacterium]
MSGKVHLRLRLGTVALVRVDTRIPLGLAERFRRRCAELECSQEEALAALIEAFVEGTPGDPEDRTESLQGGFPSAGVQWEHAAERSPAEQEEVPKEEDVWAFWRDMQHNKRERFEPGERLPFVITPFQN